MAASRRRKKTQKTKRSVVVCTMVIEHDEDGDIENMETDGVIPNLAEWVTSGVQDEASTNDDGTLFYVVRDVAVFSEQGFMQEIRRYGHPTRFPDVWVNGPPPELTVVNLDDRRSA